MQHETTFYRARTDGPTSRPHYGEDETTDPRGANNGHEAVGTLLGNLPQERYQGNRPPKKEQSVITVRLDSEIHLQLLARAHQHRTSLNKLCISALQSMLTRDSTPPTTTVRPTPV